MEIKAIRGFNDILPEEIGKWHFVEKIAREVFESFGFREIRIPVLERTELFSRGIGEATDIVEKEMYTFKDKSGNSITLRPEATASMARAYLEHRLYAIEPFSKLYFIGPMFRYERPQKGRYRQFYQIDVEVFGISNPIIDAEIMFMLMYFLKKIGLEDLELQINSLGCRECRPKYREELKRFLEKDSFKFCEDCKRRMTTNPLRIFDCKIKTCQQIIEGAPKVGEYLCSECQRHFNQVRKYLELIELSYTINPKMVRGLDYYTRTAFEVISYQLGAQSAVSGGGRYDNLFQEIGGIDIPGIGFAIGVERILSLLKEDRGFVKFPHIFIATLGKEALEEGFKIVNQLYIDGIWAEMDYEGKSLKSQMRKADRLNVPYVVIIGEEELKKRKVILRNMKDKSQQEIPLSEILGEIKNRTKVFTF